MIYLELTPNTPRARYYKEKFVEYNRKYVIGTECENHLIYNVILDNGDIITYVPYGCYFKWSEYRTYQYYNEVITGVDIDIFFDVLHFTGECNSKLFQEISKYLRRWKPIIEPTIHTLVNLSLCENENEHFYGDNKSHKIRRIRRKNTLIEILQEAIITYMREEE